MQSIHRYFKLLTCDRCCSERRGPHPPAKWTSFSCVANWLINDMEMQQLIASYSTSGKFESLTLERYDLKQ